MKGLRTFAIFALISLAGWVDQFSGILKQCQLDPASNTEICSIGIPGWAVGVIGMLGMGLRFITTTPIFKK